MGGRLTALNVSARLWAEDVVALLLALGANADLAEAEGNTALIYASLNNHDGVIGPLLDGGAAINHTINRTKEPLCV